MAGTALDPRGTRPAGPGEQSPTGRISLTGITGVGHHGVYDFERERGQRFVADVVCTLDLDTAARSDDVADTVDYGTLASAIKADIEGEPLNLIESLAARIATTCLTDPRVRSVAITVHKPNAPMPVETADVSVTLTRSRL